MAQPVSVWLQRAGVTQTTLDVWPTTKLRQQGALPVWSLLVRHATRLVSAPAGRRLLVKAQDPIRRQSPYAPVNHTLSGGRLAYLGESIAEWGARTGRARSRHLAGFEGASARIGAFVTQGQSVQTKAGTRGRWSPPVLRRGGGERRLPPHPDRFVRALYVGPWLYVYVDVCAHIRPFR